MSWTELSKILVYVWMSVILLLNFILIFLSFRKQEFNLKRILVPIGITIIIVLLGLFLIDKIDYVIPVLFIMSIIDFVVYFLNNKNKS